MSVRFRGARSDVTVPAPVGEFSTLAMQELSLDAVKRRYVQAVFFWNRSISKTAKVLGVDRNTVYSYLFAAFKKYREHNSWFRREGELWQFTRSIEFFDLLGNPYREEAA